MSNQKEVSSASEEDTSSTRQDGRSTTALKNVARPPSLDAVNGTTVEPVGVSMFIDQLGVIIGLTFEQWVKELVRDILYRLHWDKEHPLWTALFQRYQALVGRVGTPPLVTGEAVYPHASQTTECVEFAPLTVALSLPKSLYQFVQGLCAALNVTFDQWVTWELNTELQALEQSGELSLEPEIHTYYQELILPELHMPTTAARKDGMTQGETDAELFKELRQAMKQLEVHLDVDIVVACDWVQVYGNLLKLDLTVFLKGAPSTQEALSRVADYLNDRSPLLELLKQWVTRTLAQALPLVLDLDPESKGLALNQQVSRPTNLEE